VNDASANHRRIEARLRERYTEIWADVRRDLHAHEQRWYERLVRSAGHPEDEADRGDEAKVAEIDRELEELRAVHAALARLKRGDYGLCLECGDEIPAARLEAAPHAALCTVCEAQSGQSGVSAPRGNDGRSGAQNRNV
jgi:RNA polymerase-binding transcription factor DksA